VNDANQNGVGLAFVLDDDPKVGTVVCKILSGLGISARKFIDAEHFLHDVSRSNPDLVILDLALGNTDAVEVIRQLETLKFNGKVLLTSGRDETMLSEIEQIGRTHSLYMLPSLRKPFRISDIKERLLAAPEPQLAKTATGDEHRNAREGHPRLRLEEALRKNWLELWYQPKIDLKSFTVCGAEALIRGRHPEHGTIEPGELLPPAGDPLYKPLSFFVLRQTMTDWAVFADKGFPLKLSINVPASILNTPGFVDLARRLIPRDPGFPGVIIEVTEDEFIRNPEWMREVATQLKLYNAWISIDDFGTAYASLSRLTDLPFVELKLDRSFVSNCANDKLKYALCQTVVDLAHRFGASLCAEGVETAEDLRCLTKLGFDSAQGYFLAKPMLRDRFVASFLTSQRAVVSTSPSSLKSDDATEPRANAAGGGA
jgi:EAL domain-containing protein (putative c-di-GMP-specific phosphodiesterase class I)/FixJ family two-component response regulator